MGSWDWIELVRPKNVVLASSAVIVGAWIARPSQWAQSEIALVALYTLAVMAFMGAGNTLNDIADYSTDKLNHPSRVLPSGRVGIEQAKHIAWTFAGISGLCMVGSIFFHYRGGGSADISGLIIWLCAVILMLTYDSGPATKKQGLIGNIAISVLVGLTIIFGAAAVGDAFNPLVLLVGLTATLVNLAREIVKDCEDIEGDKDRSTLPMRIGIENARMAAYLIALAGMVVAALPYYLAIGGLSIGLLPIQLPAILLVLTLNGTISQGHDRKAQRRLRVAMMLGLIGFAASLYYAA